MGTLTARLIRCSGGPLPITSLVLTTGCLLYRGDRRPHLVATGTRGDGAGCAAPWA